MLKAAQTQTVPGPGVYVKAGERTLQEGLEPSRLLCCPCLGSPGSWGHADGITGNWRCRAGAGGDCRSEGCGL